MNTFHFVSRETSCKTPFGAVPIHTRVHFTFTASSEAVKDCFLLCYAEFSDTHFEIPLEQHTHDRGKYSAIFTAPAAAELIFYHFSIHYKDGSVQYYGKNGVHTSENIVPWQLTVYDDTTTTPSWFGEGICYQIFPDRFCRSKNTADVSKMVGHRSLHTDWNEMMVYLPNEHGEVTNSDFFGGDLKGITEKLPLLAELSVTTLYLNPIFEASSNHRYDTADYMHIDPLLGSEEDFKRLCAEAKKYNIHVILDGVFNHTGRNSVYFNAEGFYPSVGAAQKEDSPYADWYHFSHWPDSYDAWWGIHTLPAVNEDADSYVNFTVKGKDSVIRHWLRAGADGWRLDVADELPDHFIENIRHAMEETKPNSFLLGEVWEDGSNKIAYSQRRRYLLGHETHGLMNYPFRNALLAYLRGGNAEDFMETMETIRENYPPAAFYSCMNFLSTHDTPRILTLLGKIGDSPADKTGRAVYRLSDEEHRRGLALLKLAALLMYVFPGSPTIYYGDEVGMQGFEDPFNRGTYPWGAENNELRAYFVRLGQIRKQYRALQCGNISYPYACGRGLAIMRCHDSECCLAIINAGDAPLQCAFPWYDASMYDYFSGDCIAPKENRLSLSLPPFSATLLVNRTNE